MTSPGAGPHCGSPVHSGHPWLALILRKAAGDPGGEARLKLREMDRMKEMSLAGVVDGE